MRPISRSTVPYVVGTLDRVKVTYTDQRTEVYEVRQDGTLLLPDSAAHVRGLTKAQMDAKLRSQLSGVAEIEIAEFYPDEITVLGEVFHQIHTSLGGTPMRVLDGIAAANGFTPLANKRRVKLIRQNAGNVEVYELDLRRMLRGENLSQNLLLQPGDVISVPRNFL